MILKQTKAHSPPGGITPAVIFCEILTNFLLILSLLVSGTLEHQSADVKDKRYEKLTPLSVGIHNNREGRGSGQKDFFQTQTNITRLLPL